MLRSEEGVRGQCPRAGFRAAALTYSYREAETSKNQTVAEGDEFDSDYAVYSADEETGTRCAGPEGDLGDTFPGIPFRIPPTL